MSATETVPFDLDDTTCAYRRDADEVLAAAFERAGVEPFFDRVDWAAVAHEVEEAGSQACFRRTAMGTLAERRGRDVDHAHAVASGAERDHGDVRSSPALARCSTDSARTPVGLVTNGALEMQEPELAALSLTDRFEAAVYAGAETLAEPHPSPFERVLDRLSTPDGRSTSATRSPATWPARRRPASGRRGSPSGRHRARLRPRP